VKAAEYKKPFDIEIVERDDPPRGKAAVVRVIATGICGGDLHFYDGTFSYASYPRIGGHEIVGEVEYAPDNKSGISRGDIVVVDPMEHCGKCVPCRHGKTNCCTSIHVLGVQVDGGFCERIAVPPERLYKTGSEMSVERAVLCEPYTIAYHATERAGIEKDDEVLVAGAGTIGLAVADLATASGAKVTIVDRFSQKLNVAKQLGVFETVDTSTVGLSDFVRERTGGEGFYKVFEATGNPNVIASCIDSVCPGGTITVIGLLAGSVTINGLDLTRKEMTILGSRNSISAFSPVIGLFKGRSLHPELLLTHRYPFVDIKKAFEYTFKNPKDVIKAAVFFQ
jgi:L-gulonate 5-dehydrogenase